MKAWLQRAAAYVGPQTRKKCEEEKGVHSKCIMQIVMGEGETAGKAAALPHPCVCGEVGALTQHRAALPSPSLAYFAQLSCLKHFYVKLEGFLAAAAIFKVFDGKCKYFRRWL